MKAKFLKVALIFSLVIFFTNCSKNDDESAPIQIPTPIESINPLSMYLITSGFNEKTTNQINNGDYEFGYSFTPNVNGKISALVVKIPATNSALRLTVWNKTTNTVLKTETIDYNAANVEVTKEIAGIDIVPGTEYMVSMNSNDWYNHQRNASTNTTYPINLGAVSITGYAFRSGTAQAIPNNAQTSYYAGDISFKFTPNAAIAADTKLSLPATLENTTALSVPDATNNTGDCGSAVNMGSAESTINITSGGYIADPTKVSIEVDLAHTYSGDVVLELIAPGGASCGLIKRIGATTDTSCGSSADFITGNKLTFNAAFATPLAGPYATGNYAPTQGTGITFPTAVFLTPLTTFLNGKNIKGVWKLKVYDCGVGDQATLNSWKLKFDAGALQ